MSIRGILVRVAASAAALVILVGVALAAAPTPEVDEALDSAGQVPDVLLEVVVAGGEAGVAAGVASAPVEPEPPQAADGGTGTGTGGAIEILPGLVFTPRVPETQASVFATISAYRSERNLPTYTDSPWPNGECVWGPGGSILPWDIPPSESLGAALIRRIPAAVNYNGPAGSAVVVLVNADTFIDSATGTAYPGQVAIITVKHCFPPVTPPPPPPPPPPPSTEPTEPSPSTEPTEPSPSEPTP